MSDQIEVTRANSSAAIATEAATRAAADTARDTTRGQIGMWAIPNMGYFFTAQIATASNYRAVRFVPTRNMTVVKMGFAVTSAAGADDSIDVGICDAAGVRIVSSGATAGLVNSTGRKTVTVTSTPLTAGTAYYAVLAYGTAGATAATFLAIGGVSVFGTAMFGSTAGTLEVSASIAGATVPDPITFTAGSANGFALALLES